MKTTVDNIQTYNLNGTVVYLADMDDVPGVTPIDYVGNIGAYTVDSYNGCLVRCTTDDAYSGVSSDCDTAIISAACVNPENDQRLVEGWWTKEYYTDDLFSREYLTTTDNYYDWTSARTRMINRLVDKSREGVITAEAYSALEEEWDNAVLDAVRGCANYAASDAPFEALLEEAGITK